TPLTRCSTPPHSHEQMACLKTDTRATTGRRTQPWIRLLPNLGQSPGQSRNCKVDLPKHTNNLIKWLSCRRPSTKSVVFLWKPNAFPKRLCQSLKCRFR